MVGSHKTRSLSLYDVDTKAVSEVKFMCTECGKTLKTQEKFEIHCMGHGDPELECNKCHKVFASKFSLRTHHKIHSRKHACNYCAKTYTEREELRAHAAKIHFMFMCESCDFIATNYRDLYEHQKECHTQEECVKESSETDFVESFVDYDTETGMFFESPEDPSLKWEQQSASAPSTTSKTDEIKKADSIIAKVMSNKIFLLHAKKARQHRKYNKVNILNYFYLSTPLDRYYFDVKHLIVRPNVQSRAPRHSPLARPSSAPLCFVCLGYRFLEKLNVRTLSLRIE